MKHKTHPQLDLFLLLKGMLKHRQWLFPPTNDPVDLSPSGVFWLGDCRFIGMSEKGERILHTWQRKGLHISWGMHRPHYPYLYHDANVRWWIGDRQEYTTHAEYDQRVTNLQNFMTAVHLSIETGDYPLDDLNQNDAHVG